MIEIVEDPADELEILEDPSDAVAIDETGTVIVPGAPIPPTAEQVREAIDAYFADNPVSGPSPEQIAEAVAAWLALNPPADGDPATQEQVQIAVDAFLLAHPIEVPDPLGPSPEQVAAAVAAYLTEFPPEPGDSVTPEQTAAAVALYMETHPIDPVPPTAGQVQTAVAIYLGANPVPGPSPEQIGDAVAAYLVEFPPEPGDPGDNATPEQIALAVANYMQQYPAPGPSDMQVAAAVAAYLAENPAAADDEQVNALIDAYFSPDGALRESMKGANNGIATLDASGGLVQRMKIAAHSTPGIIRDAEGSGNGKAALYPASIAMTGETAVIIRTGIWQGDLDYAFRVFGTGAAGVINLNVYRIVRAGVPTYGYMNNGTVPVDITFGMDGEGYSNWAIEGDFDRAQLVVTDNAVTGGGGDPQVRDWWASATSSRPLPLASQVVVPRVMPPA